jgi:ATP-dependent DNA helicase RecG
VYDEGKLFPIASGGIAVIESEVLEFKGIVTGDIYKSVVAFANTSGGTLIIGVEEMRSLEQELTFNECTRIFADNKIAFGEDKYNILGIRSQAQNQYTNLALLLSDQCAHTIKVAVFADEQNTVFRDRKEFSGSVLRQAEETFDYLRLNNKNLSVIEGLSRKDFWDYPADALREALLNAIIHRDYSFSGSTIININDNRIEVVSIGGLLPGISTQDIRNGISQLRNRRLADVFHRLNFVEAYGTGIRRIFALYKDSASGPEIVETPNSFKLVLPNINIANAVRRGAGGPPS